MATSKKRDGIDEKMKQKGFISVSEAGERIGVELSTIYRWMDSGEVGEVRALDNRRFANVRDLVNKVGIEASVLLGLITQEQGQKLSQEKKE